MSGVWVDQLRLRRRQPSAAAVHGWPPGTRIVSLPNARIRVRDVGRGDRVIMLTPDAPVVLENYGALIEQLAPHARVVCFEFPGCGFSVPGFGFDFSIPHYAGVVKGVMDALAIDRATLAFTCINATVAMAFAHEFPERVERLALAQVASVDEMRAYARHIDGRIAGIPVLHTPVLGQVLMALRRDAAALSWFRRALPKGFDVDRIWNVTRPVLEAGGQFCMASIIQGQIGVTSAEVQVRDCPVSVVWGDADRTHAHTDKDSVLRQVPDAHIDHLPACGHLLDIEAPEAYARMLLRA